VNVGGRKVAMGEVEAVLLQVPGVHLVEVTGAASSVAGQIVQANVVLRPGYDGSTVRQQLMESCQAQLERYKWPRIINFVTSLDVSAAGKIRRTYA
jgi:acyl-coenzyme A synthetase/AMP-(fatty) acid ligase